MDEGEVQILAGENGAGKSTLVKCIAQVVKATSGEVECLGNIAMAHQELSLVDDLTVLENLFLAKEITKLSFVDKSSQKAIAQDLFKEVGYSLELDRVVRSLSLPEKNMLEILKALLERPKILILDEPTSSLPQNLVEILFECIKKLKKSGVGIFYISHKMDELKEIADTISILRDGNFIFKKSFHNISMDEIVNAMVGRDLGDFYPDKIKINESDAKLELSDFSVIYNGSEFGRHYCVYPMNLELKKGEVLGLAGLEGSGHSEFLKSLFENKKIWGNNEIAFMPCDRKKDGLIINQSIEKNITLAHLVNSSPWKFLNLGKLKNLALEYSKKVRVKFFNIEDDISTLSGGNQQKIVLAKWLMANPDIILMDEPTRGVDIGAKTEIYTFIREFVALKKSVILYSSEIPELMGVCDRIIVFHQGRITGEFKDVKLDHDLQEKILQRALGVIDESDSNEDIMDTKSNSKSSGSTDSSSGDRLHI